MLLRCRLCSAVPILPDTGISVLFQFNQFCITSKSVAVLVTDGETYDTLPYEAGIRWMKHNINQHECGVLPSSQRLPNRNAANVRTDILVPNFTGILTEWQRMQTQFALVKQYVYFRFAACANCSSVEQNSHDLSKYVTNLLCMHTFVWIHVTHVYGAHRVAIINDGACVCARQQYTSIRIHLRLSQHTRQHKVQFVVLCHLFVSVTRFLHTRQSRAFY